MRRILIVGSTGSIGTQALDVVARSDSLEVVGLAAHSNAELLLEQSERFGAPRLALADPDAAARAGEGVLAGPEGLVELITDTDCDLVLNALVGLRRPGPDRRRAGRGDRPRARQQGEPGGGRRAGHRAGGGHRRRAAAGGLRALGPVPACERRAAGHRRPACAHRLRRALPRPHRPRRHHGGGRAGPSDLGHGRQDHRGLRDAHEQGPGGDRGPPSLRRPVRPDRRGGAPAVDRALADPSQRRRHARAPRLPRHGGADLLRAAPPRPRRRAGGARSTWRASAASTSSRPTRTRSPACAWRARRGSRAAPRRACSTPRTRWPWPPSWRAGCRSRRSPR